MAMITEREYYNFCCFSYFKYGGNWKSGGSGAKDSGNSRGEGVGWLIYMEFPDVLRFNMDSSIAVPKTFLTY